MNQKQQEELRQQKEQLRQQRQQYNETIRQAEQGKSNTPLTVDQLRQEFQNAFLWCHSEFDIYVPFLGTVFGSKIFKKNIRACLERGVIIKIRYGFANFDDYKKIRNMRKKFMPSCRKDTSIDTISGANCAFIVTIPMPSC